MPDDTPAAMLARLQPRNKYRARKVEAYGHTFDSTAEYRRYLQLRDMADNGEIRDLQIHPSFEIIPRFRDWTGKHHGATYYEADFRYTDRQGHDTVEDVKGVRTKDYVLKRKLWLSLYSLTGVRFLEIDARTLRPR
jgi:muconolactone delta-isomerase